MVIAAYKLIANKEFNINAGLMPICKVDGNTSVMVKGKIVLVSARTGVGIAEEELTEALLSSSGLKNADDVANGAGNNKVVVGDIKKEISI